MRVTIAGASGFLGRHLTDSLLRDGHDVTILVRGVPASTDQPWSEFVWDPAVAVLPQAAIAGSDVVINLCGAGVADRRWTKARQGVLRSSRLSPTRLLAAACATESVPVLVNASAVGIYADRGDEELTEDSDPGAGFLAELCVDWEQAAVEAAGRPTRIVRLRTGLVLGTDGGMLPRLAALTRLMLGGRLGSGRQWWPWISVHDHVAAVRFLMGTDIAGPVNLTAPNPVTSAEFTAELGRQLGRRTPWVIPGFALRAVLGGFAAEVLGGQRALPQVLTAAGFEFQHPELAGALAELLENPGAR